MGSNVYGENNPTSIIFPTSIEILLFPTIPLGRKQYCQVPPIITRNLSQDWEAFIFFTSTVGSPVSPQFYIKKNETATQFDIFSTTTAKYQFNYSFNVFYGLSQNNNTNVTSNFFLINKSGTFVVPYTGKYYLELYGGGGGEYSQSVVYNDGQVTGATSVQSYSNVLLQKDAKISVTIGEGGVGGWQNTSGSSASTNGGKTIFGGYSVNGRNSAYDVTYSPSGQGNLGTDGFQAPSYSSTPTINYSKGTLAAWNYGYATLSDGAKGCVCLKYLGA